MTIRYRKMNGLGNDFVVVDARAADPGFDTAAIRALGDRRTGIGFDQFILIAPPREGGNARMVIHNQDGGEVEACGNAARCVAAVLLQETGADRVTIESLGGTLVAKAAEEGRIAIDMGVPRFDAASIPLAAGSGDPLALAFDDPVIAPFGPGAAVNVGNPHVIFTVADPEAVPLARVGPHVETHPVFPDRVNVSFIAIQSAGEVRARVWERGVGETLACGTAACAIAAVGHRLGRTGSRLRVHLPGGPLDIALADGRIIMTGPYALDGEGTIPTDARAAG